MAAVCLLSGGMDSSVTIAHARRLGFRVHALTVSYGQRQRVELEAASKVAKALGADSHRTIAIDVRVLGGAHHTRPLPVHAARGLSGAGESGRVPAVGAMMLALALTWADALRARHLFVGPNLLGSARGEGESTPFQSAIEAVGTLSGPQQSEPFRICAPLMGLTKAEVITRAASLGVDLSMTHTCSNPVPLPVGIVACGACESCLWRLQGFRHLSRCDPLPYVEHEG